MRSCIIQRDAAKSGLNAQNATRGAMQSDQVETTGTRFFAFSATLNNALPVYLNYNVGQNTIVSVFQ